MNHPNIAVIYGLERSGTAAAIAMELIEGPTLAERIAQGAIPLDEAVPIAKQLGEALEAAHEQGIIHRDLKPANIKVRPDGVVKVLDFGLAKAMEPAPALSLSMSPTITTPAMTKAGIILGTAAYMSPEQARGKPVDKRSDIWAFGCVVFEMLTGKRAFDAEDVSLMLAEVMKSEPDWTALPDLPPTLRMCLRRCFNKDPRQRLRDIGEMRLALEGALDTDLPLDATTSSAATPGPVWKWVAPSSAATVAAVIAALVTMSLQPKPIPQVVRFQIHAPAGNRIPPGTPAISPDGHTLAYVVTGGDGTNRIHVRNLDDVASRALEGTENAVHPFWSPDGRSLAFVSERVLKRIDIAGGGAVRPVATQISAPWQGAWNQFGDLLFLIAGAGLVRMPGEGGKPLPVMSLNTFAGETGARFPFFLPDGRRFLLFIGSEGKNAIHLASLDSADRTLVVDDVLSAPLLAPTPGGRSYLLYLQDEALVAQEFDDASGQVRATPRIVVDGIGRVASPSLMPTVGVSASGTLAFQTGGDFTAEMFTWFSRAGARTGVVSLEVSGINPSLSPDGHLVAFQGSASGDLDVWVTDVARGVTSRLTRGGGPDRSAIWSPDGHRVAFLRSGKIYVKNADGSGDETVLADVAGAPRAWSSDGKYLVYESQQKLFLWPLSAGGAPIPVGPRDGSSRDGRLSPDGRFIAYTSDLSGSEEIYVEALPPATGRARVSANGGRLPRWSRSTPELFFIASDRTLMVVDIHLGAPLSAGAPRKLFSLNTQTNTVGYDVTGDGQRFLVNSLAEEVPDTPITVVLNWWADLAQRSN